MCTNGNKVINAGDQANGYVELAKINQDSLWKRRSVQWKVNFGLWVALAAVAGFVFQQESQIPFSAWMILCIGYFAVLLGHIWFLVTCFASDELDLGWMVYYIQQVELALGADIPHDHLRDLPHGISRWQFIKGRGMRLKYLGNMSGTLITITLMIAGLALMWQRIKW